MINSKAVRLKQLYEYAQAQFLKITDDNADYRNPVFGCGNTDARVMFVGEAPGASEVEAGKPFVGKAGKQLDAMLEKAGLSRSDLFVTNAVKYRTWKKRILSNGKESISNRTPTSKELTSASELLFSEIICVKPKIVVSLGNSPLFSIKSVTGLCDIQTISQIHGNVISVENTEHDFMLFPLYHPASGIYNRSLVEVMENDLKLLAQFAEKIL